MPRVLRIPPQTRTSRPHAIRTISPGTRVQAGTPQVRIESAEMQGAPTDKGNRDCHSQESPEDERLPLHRIAGDVTTKQRSGA